jgi:chemotaxis protein methyltransferase WspC
MVRYKEVESLLAELVGLDVHSIGERIVTRAVSRRVDSAFSGDYPAFLRALRTEGAAGDEFRKLMEALVVPETWFFRDCAAWELLFATVRDQWADHPERGLLRALSAPCSTGEETYSIAITLAAAGLSPPRFAIDGVDLSRTAIERARNGLYGDRCFRGPLQDAQAKFFNREEGGNLRVSPALTSRVRLWDANLVEEQALAGSRPYDLVFCKNLAIYLTTEARARLIANVRDWLEPGGILFVGHSELPFFQKAGFKAVSFPRSFALTASIAQEPAALDRAKKVSLRFFPERTKVLTPGSRTAEKPAGLELAVEPAVEKARQLADQGELPAARELCECLIKGNSLDARVYYLAGLIEQASDRTDQAGELFGKAVYLDPAHYESLVQLSLMAEKRGETGKADHYRWRASKAREKSRDSENAQR